MAAVENGIVEIRNGLIGNASSPGVYEQVRTINSTVRAIDEKFDTQLDTITAAVESYKSSVWYVRGLIAAVAIGAAVAGWIANFVISWK